MSDGIARAEVEVGQGPGVHARPTLKLTMLAKRYRATIRLGAGDGPWVDAKSVVKVMALKIKAGSRIRLEAEGEDAVAAVAALADLVRRDFETEAHG